MTEGTSEQSSSAALKPSDFVHLHNHTFHSVLDGLTKIHDLVDKVKELGMEAAAVTDHGTMSGILDYYKTAKKAGIKPIIGIETYVATRSRLDARRIIATQHSKQIGLSTGSFFLELGRK
jgi:DNA polymerase III subunit alpha